MSAEMTHAIPSAPSALPQQNPKLRLKPPPRTRARIPKRSKAVATTKANSAMTIPASQPIVQHNKPGHRAGNDAGVERSPTSRPINYGVHDPATLADLAPGDAALTLLLRMDRIRESPFAENVKRLLEVFYDYKTLLWSPELDPTKDFNTLLIATSNPYRVTETFLAANYTLPPRKMRKILEHSTYFGGHKLRWSRSESSWKGEIPSPPKLPHDPRTIFIQDHLILLSHPKYFDLLSTSSPPSPAPDGGLPKETWLQRLIEMDPQVNQGSNGPGMLVQAVNLPRLIRIPSHIPVPINLRGTISAAVPTVASLQLSFANNEEAKRFHQVIPDYIAKAKQIFVLRFLGITNLLDSVIIKRHENQLIATVELSVDQARGLLEMMRNLIPPVEVPGMPPRVRPDGGLPAPRARSKTLHNHTKLLKK